MQHYRFVTDWSFNAPLEKVWAVTRNVSAVSSWWPGVKKAVSRDDAGPLKLGTVIDVSVRGLLGDLEFALEVSWIDPPRKLQLESSGDLQGFGLWTLEQEGNITKTRIHWEIDTTGWLMNLVGLILRPFFERSHKRVMARGYKSLKLRLEA